MYGLVKPSQEKLYCHLGNIQNTVIQNNVPPEPMVQHS